MLLLYILLNAAALVHCVCAKKQLDDFLDAHPSIGSQKDISDFRRLARSQMYMALLQIVFLGMSLLIGLALIWTGGIRMLLIVLLANGVVFFAARWIKPTEARVQNLPCLTTDLSQTKQFIVDSWKKKPLPDF
ncbi:MAG: hypothetical protein JXO72_09725 [Vicinamibacteria bacterium]|nr:hypothetical protein [Vicinamibacteria bacterium]